MKNVVPCVDDITIIKRDGKEEDIDKVDDSIYNYLVDALCETLISERGNGVYAVTLHDELVRCD